MESRENFTASQLQLLCLSSIRLIIKEELHPKPQMGKTINTFFLTIKYPEANCQEKLKMASKF